jgi:cytochrome c1
MRRLMPRPGVAALLAAVFLGGCGFGAEHAMSETQAAQLTGGGSAARGRTSLRAYGCGSCHSIAGVPGATSLVGPPLASVGERAYIAGVLTNSPDHMVRWIRDPRGVDPLTAMPNLGVTDRDARDMAAYLYSIR